MSGTARQILRKQPSESRPFAMDFTQRLQSGEIITEILEIKVTPNSLTIGEPVVQQNSFVAFMVSNGIHNTKYRVEVDVRTSLGYQHQGDGILIVGDL